MALTKQPININFSQGVDTKTDPFQVEIGKFLKLENSVFNTGGQLQKRNGYQTLQSLPDTTSKYLTTFSGNLAAIGTSLFALSAGNKLWVNKGNIEPLNLNTLPLVRSSTNQTQADSVTASNGLTCVVYTDQIPSGGTNTPAYKYVIIDSTTGQNVVAPTILTGVDATYGTPRVFLLGNYFIVLFTTHPAAYHLQYIAISTTNPSTVTAPIDISTSYIPSTTLAFDALVVNSNLYIAYNTTSGGQSVKVTYLNQNLGSSVTPTTFVGSIATMFTMAADMLNSSNPIIYVSFYDAVGSTGYTCAVDKNLNQILAPTQIIASGTYLNLASTAYNGSAQIYLEKSNTYTYDTSIHTNLIQTLNITQSGTVGSTTTLVRSVGLASKAFLYNNQSYFLAIYDSLYQPSYFLINNAGQVIAKLAYSNGPTYYTTGLPNVQITDTIVQISYLIKDQIQAVNKDQGVANTVGVYSQLGVNLASFDFSPSNILTAEIGSNLNITGGYISAYDGVTPVEQGFFLWPDYVEASIIASGGNLAVQQYYYQVTYEWSDNQGNTFRSAPSIPVSANVTTGGGSASVTLDIPTLRLTYKINNPVKIVIYRWSAGQQNYYQVTSVNAPLLNDPTVDYITYTDTLADSSILGNNLIYTTGGVLEDISPPGSNIMALFNNRLWLVDAEDRNLLWYSKQVIENTPVEMSDLLTLYVAPTTASEGSTGPITALYPMDDKLIVFKKFALGYINGIGPDNTGSNSSYSDFILINSVAGCSNPQSIVLTPNGLIFQSSKGLWLLGRDLSTNYIGAPVEALTAGATVLSAVSIPTQNQVRFTLDSGITLMYDYYYNQWGTFTGVPAISSTIYEGLHTYINDLGQVLQESPGMYLDNTNPVLMSFQTSWLNLAGLQGYERFYQMYLLGVYKTPFKLNVSLAYDYQPANSTSIMVTPISPSPAWGGDNFWGDSTPWGGATNVFEARVFPQIQKCESFQVSINEIYDPSFGISAGAGLTLSGMNLVVGMKKGYRTQSAARSFGK